MTWEELLTWEIVENLTWTIQNIWFWGDPQFLKMMWGLVKSFVVWLRPLVRILLIVLVVLLVIYIIVLLVFNYLTKKQKKKVQDDIPEEYKEFKKIWKYEVVNNMYDYWSVYNPDQQKIVDEKEEKLKKLKEELNKPEKDVLSSIDEKNESKKVVIM